MYEGIQGPCMRDIITDHLPIIKFPSISVFRRSYFNSTYVAVLIRLIVSEATFPVYFHINEGVKHKLQ